MDFHHLLFAGFTGAPTIWMRASRQSGWRGGVAAC
jgi:hypothetical protein